MGNSRERILLILPLLLLCLSISEAIDCQLNFQNPYRVAYSIYVDQSGRGNFRTVQSAIDSIPFQNSRWIRIQISRGIYWEKVTIPRGKSCIFIDGVGNQKDTVIQFNDHASTETSAVFTSYAENLVVRGITFRNVYNAPGTVKKWQDIAPAVAAHIEGDKSYFYGCSFIGLQDTLWDGNGRHYYGNCYIEGVIDFIFGAGQSLYEGCVINVAVNEYAPVLSYGYITAQGKESASEGSGFVFKKCVVGGSGRAYLGRAWRPFSTVIFFDSNLSGIIDPAGWDAWQQTPASLLFAEVDCYGAGSDTSKRVSWMKKLSTQQVKPYVHISYIDKDGWTTRLPKLV